MILGTVGSLFNDDGFKLLTPAGDFAESEKPKTGEIMEKPHKSSSEKKPPLSHSFSLPESTKEVCYYLGLPDTSGLPVLQIFSYFCSRSLSAS